MKVTVIGSHLCPDTLYALNRLSEVKAEIEFKNLSASLPDLKAYLAPRRVSAVLQTSVTAPVPPSSICRRAARVPRVVPSWVSRIAVRDSSSVDMHFAMATAVA